jgi:hypothetical protein
LLTICFNFAMPKHAQPFVGPKNRTHFGFFVGFSG